MYQAQNEHIYKNRVTGLKHVPGTARKSTQKSSNWTEACPRHSTKIYPKTSIWTEVYPRHSTLIYILHRRLTCKLHDLLLSCTFAVSVRPGNYNPS